MFSSFIPQIQQTQGGGSIGGNMPANLMQMLQSSPDAMKLLNTPWARPLLDKINQQNPNWQNPQAQIPPPQNSTPPQPNQNPYGQQNQNPFMQSIGLMHPGIGPRPNFMQQRFGNMMPQQNRGWMQSRGPMYGNRPQYGGMQWRGTQPQQQPQQQQQMTMAPQGAPQ